MRLLPPCGSRSHSALRPLAPPKNLTRGRQIPGKVEAPVTDQEETRRAAAVEPRELEAEVPRAVGPAARVAREPLRAVRRDRWTAPRERAGREKVERAPAAARAQDRVAAEPAGPAQMGVARLAPAALAPAGSTRAEPTRPGPTPAGRTVTAVAQEVQTVAGAIAAQQTAAAKMVEGAMAADAMAG